MQSESASMNIEYLDDSIESTPETSHVAVGSFDKSNIRVNKLKYSIVQQHWNKLYSEENSLRLQDAVKKFIYKNTMMMTGLWT